jgi:hypothetical protein
MEYGTVTMMAREKTRIPQGGTVRATRFSFPWLDHGGIILHQALDKTGLLCESVVGINQNYPKCNLAWAGAWIA